jgi:GH24 family phage-related lysozyme (muramidase)
MPDLAKRINAIQRLIGVPETGTIDLATCNELESRGNILVDSTNLVANIKAVQKLVNATADGIIGPQTITKIESFIAPVLPKLSPGASLIVSTESMDMLISFEVTSKTAYDKKYQQPTWPGGASGVTIGIGFDLGYYSASDIKNAWAALISQNDLGLLLTVAGKTGATAKNVLSSVNAVRIPYTTAAKVFYQSTLPSFAKQVRKIYPGVEKLPPDAQGALLSLVYNRGSDISPNKPKRKEMFNIVAAVAGNDLTGIAREIRNMKRLWPDMKGLRDRRDMEATMVENATLNILPEDLIIV